MRLIFKIFIVLLFLLTVGCKDKLILKKTYYPNGSIHFEDYYNEKNIIQKKIVYYKEGKTIIDYIDAKKKTSMMYNNKDILLSKYVFLKNDSCISTDFYSNKIITGKGKVNKEGNLIGWWSFFDEKNVLKEKQEYIIIDGKQYFNQGILYGNDGKINLEHSQFVTINFKKSELKNVFIGKLNYNNIINKNSKIAICIGKTIKDDYSNIDKVKLDTFLFKNKKIKEFPIILKDFGQKFKGFVLEIYPINQEDTLSKKNVEMIQHKMYFDVAIPDGIGKQ